MRNPLLILFLALLLILGAHGEEFRYKPKSREELKEMHETMKQRSQQDKEKRFVPAPDKKEPRWKSRVHAGQQDKKTPKNKPN